MSKARKRRAILSVASALFAAIALLAGCSTSKQSSEIEPYTDYLGADAGETISLPSDLYDDIDSVEFLGREGSVSFEQSWYNAFEHIDVIDELVWESNDEVTHDEFEKFIHDANSYFGYEAEQEEMIGDPCFDWDETDTGCSVRAMYDAGHVVLYWTD